MASGHDTIALPASFAELLDPDDRPIDDNPESSNRVATNFALEIKSPSMDLINAETGALTLDPIDSYRFSWECLMRAIESLHARLRILSFAAVQGCVAERQSGLDLAGARVAYQTQSL